MQFELTLQSVIFFAGSLLSFFLALMVYQRRPAPGSFPLTVFIMAVAWWCLFYGFEYAATSYEAVVLYAKLEYIGITATGLAWLFFTLELSGVNNWKTVKVILPLTVIPLLTLLLVLTNEWHGWIWSNIRQTGVSLHLVWEHGFWFWVFVAFNYSLFIAGVVFLLRSRWNRIRSFRYKARFLLLGTILPFLANISYLFSGKIQELNDYTPVVFLVACIFYAIAIIRFRFLDIVPVARAALIEQISDGVMLVNPVNVISYINSSVTRLMHKPKDEITEQTVGQVCPELADLLVQHPEDGIFDLECDSGGYFEINSSVLRLARGKYPLRIMIIRDVSEQKEIERNIRESETRYATLVEQSNEGVLILQGLKIKFANRRVAEFSGLNEAELADQDITELVAESDRLLLQERLIKQAHGEAIPALFELKVQGQNGQEKEVSLSVSRIEYEGKPAAIVTIRDIGKRKQTQRKLESLYAEEKKLRASLQEEIEKRSKYTRTLVHELNTPLSAILASGELLESEIRNETLIALVKNIMRSSNNLKQRIEGLIELARGETGLLRINRQPLKIEELLKEVVSELEPLANDKGLNIKTVIGVLPEIQGDHSRLKQVVLNLVSNALKYTRKGEIEIKAETKEDAVEVRVKDSGRGIGEEEMENLFDPYRRKGNEGQELSGLGIGLALSKMIVESHGGKIRVESRRGEGSTFIFTLPVNRNNLSCK